MYEMRCPDAHDHLMPSMSCYGLLLWYVMSCHVSCSRKPSNATLTSVNTNTYNNYVQHPAPSTQQPQQQPQPVPQPVHQSAVSSFTSSLTAFLKRDKK